MSTLKPFSGELDDPASFASSSGLKPFTGTIDGFLDEKPKRSLWTAINDNVIEVANAAAGNASAVANFVRPGNAASQWIDKNFIEAGQNKQSDVVKTEKARYAQEMEQAQGFGDEVSSTLGYVARNPLLAASQAAGSFAGPGLAVGGARAAVGALGMGAKAATRTGLAAGAGFGMASAGGDAAGTAYELSRQGGATDEQALDAARGASVIPGAIGAAGGLVGAERLVAGAKGFGGGLTARALKTGAVEGAQGALEEGVTQYEGQRAAVPFNPELDPTKGVAGAATMGAVLGGMTGGGTSLLTGQNQPARKPSEDLGLNPDSGPISKVAAAAVDEGRAAAPMQPEQAAQPEDGLSLAPEEQAQPQSPTMEERLAALPEQARAQADPLLREIADERVPAGVKRFRANELQQLLDAYPVPESTDTFNPEERAAMGPIVRGYDPATGEAPGRPLELEGERYQDGIDFATDEQPSQNAYQDAINRIALESYQTPGQPLAMEQAGRLRDAAREQGIPATIVPHPSGRGFDVQATAVLPEDARQQVAQDPVAAALPYDNSPTGRMVADTQGNARPELRPEAVGREVGWNQELAQMEADVRQSEALGMSNLRERIEAFRQKQAEVASMARQANQPAQAGAASVANTAMQPKEGQILQNRDRSTPGSIEQMQRIAAAPDYGRLGFSRDFANGAPVVTDANIDPAQLGRADIAVASDGRRIPVQYAVVEADTVLPSNRVDGSPNAEYSTAAAAEQQQDAETVAPTARQQTNSQQNESENAVDQAQAAINNLPANLQEGIAAAQDKGQQEQPAAQQAQAATENAEPVSQTHTNPKPYALALNQQVPAQPPDASPSKETLRAAASIPTFQGGKTKMARAITEKVRRHWGSDAAKIDTIIDYFGGSGSWGAYMAGAAFPNVKRLVIHEFNPERLHKIRLFNERGSQIEQLLAVPEVKAYFDAARREIDKKRTFSGSAIANVVARRENYQRLIEAAQNAIGANALDGLLQAVQDQGDASFGLYGKGASGDAAVNDILRRVTANAGQAYAQMQTLRERGVTIEYVTGNSYEAAQTQGKNVLAMVDPPYYATKGYNGVSLVDMATYNETRKLLDRLQRAGNSVIYTDEAWWEKHDKNTGDTVVPPDVSQQVDGLDAFGQLSSIQEMMGDFFRMPIATRMEVVGFINGNRNEGTVRSTARNSANAAAGRNIQQNARSMDSGAGQQAGGRVAPGNAGGTQGLFADADARLNGVLGSSQGKEEAAARKAKPATQAQQAQDGNGAMFSRSDAKPVTNQTAVKMRRAMVQRTVDALAKGWAKAPNVTVVDGMQDERVPEAVRKADAAQRSQGAMGEPEGFWYRGQVYLVASALPTSADAARVLYHEVLGHHGLRGHFGKDLDRVLDQVIKLRRKDVQAKAQEYGLDMSNPEHAGYAAEEVLAELAQSRPDLGFVQRAIAAIRNFLRTHVPGFKVLELTDADIVQGYLLPARGWVERGGVSSAVNGDTRFESPRLS